jgi:energy-coupling factor transport system ATP-binding protein
VEPERIAPTTVVPERYPALRVRDVSFAYPQGSSDTEEPDVALEHITLDVLPGEYVALLGHNGSGKSTLSRLFNGLLSPTSGQVLVNGLDTADARNRARIRELVGMIFSDPDNQIIATVVEDDVAWGLAARGWPAPVIAVRVEQALDAVGLRDARGRPPHELSGGQRQRLAIAGVLALEPMCVVADEPTALLDPLARREMTSLLRQLNHDRGLTIVHVTHLLEEAAAADRIVILEDGRVALEGTPGSVFAQLDALRDLRLVIPDLAALTECLRLNGVEIPLTALSPVAVLRALEAGA